MAGHERGFFAALRMTAGKGPRMTGWTLRMATDSSRLLRYALLAVIRVIPATTIATPIHSRGVTLSNRCRKRWANRTEIRGLAPTTGLTVATGA